MIVTIQLLSDSGSFGYPSEGQDVEHCQLKDIPGKLSDWARMHNRVGSDSADAVVRVWGSKLDDVTDIYPDYDFRYGPKGGVVREEL